MQIFVNRLLAGAAAARGLTVIIDVFRAFTTSCHILRAHPADYLLVGDSATAQRLASGAPGSLLVGKAEAEATLNYDVPNSPTRVASQFLERRTVIHRTAAGARGILAADAADEVVAAAFVNAGATARYVRNRKPERVTLVSMGHEGVTPSEEDELCAEYIGALLRGRGFEREPRMTALRDGAGRYFFGEDQDEYPQDDFHRCTMLDAFDFALCAERRGDYASLKAVRT